MYHSPTYSFQDLTQMRREMLQSRSFVFAPSDLYLLAVLKSVILNKLFEEKHDLARTIRKILFVAGFQSSARWRQSGETHISNYIKSW